MTLLQESYSALRPAGAEAARTGQLYNFLLGVSVVVYVVVIAAALWAALRRRTPDDGVDPARERSAHRVVFAAVTATVAILFVALVYDLAMGRALTRRESSEMLSVRLVGHQWWWEVEYEDPTPQNRVRTANEIHLPAGRPVALKLQSADVIHSFWAPNLAGKKDLIPGHHNELYLTPQQPGMYRVQCAEFCGLQHAKMSLFVIVETASDFAKWLDGQRQPAPEPADTLTARGRLVFETASCVTCHSIAGTRAQGTVGPDLTHLAGRHSLAAGSLPNTRGHLGGWIVDPQRIKPGVLMPSNGLDPADLQALLAYLGTLK